MSSTHMEIPLASHFVTPQLASINEINSFRLLNSTQQNFPSIYLIFPSRFTTLMVLYQVFTILFVNKSLVCPLFPYFYSKMTSLGLCTLLFFSLTQSSPIKWTRDSRLAHLTTTLVLQSVYALRPNIPTLLPVLFSFTSTGLRDLIYHSPKNSPTILGPPSNYPITTILLLI